MDVGAHLANKLDSGKKAEKDIDWLFKESESDVMEREKVSGSKFRSAELRRRIWGVLTRFARRSW